MGAVAACCVAREGDQKGRQQELLARRHSWSSVGDPDDYLTFFDCVEGDEVLEPTLVRSSTGESLLNRKQTLHTLKGGLPSSACHFEAIPESRQQIPDLATEDAVFRVAGKARERWAARISGGTLEAELMDKTREGFPELDEWTAPSTVRRMLRAMSQDEAQAEELLDKAITCRLRRRCLFQSLRCQVTCDARVIGMDSQQRPVVYFCTGSQTAPLAEMLPQLFLAFEAAVRIGHPEGQITLIADMKGFKARLNMDRQAIREFSDSFGSVFADRLNYILVLDFSFVAQALWSVCQPFLSQRTRAKISFVNEKEARAIVSERLQQATCERVWSAFDINRDPTSTLADREAHSKRTSICDVPLGIPVVNEAG